MKSTGTKAVCLPRMNIDVYGEKEEDALEVVLEDGRVQKVSASCVILLSGQWLNLEQSKFNQPFFDDCIKKLDHFSSRNSFLRK